MAGDEFTPFSGHSRRIFALRFHPSELHLFLTGGWDNSVKASAVPAWAAAAPPPRAPPTAPGSANGCLSSLLGLGQARAQRGAERDQRAPHLRSWDRYQGESRQRREWSGAARGISTFTTQKDAIAAGQMEWAGALSGRLPQGPAWLLSWSLRTQIPWAEQMARWSLGPGRDQASSVASSELPKGRQGTKCQLISDGETQQGSR